MMQERYVAEKYEDLRRSMYGEIGVVRCDDDRMQCHVCGKWYQSVGLHSVQAHELTADEYREAFGLNHQQGLVSPSLSDRMRRNVQQRYIDHPEQLEKFKESSKAIPVEVKRRAGEFERRQQLRQKYEENRVSFICKKCGKQIKADDSSRRSFCSQTCAAAFNGAKLVEKVKENLPRCIICGNEIPYIKHVNVKKVCSPECDRIRASRTSRQNWQSGTMKERRFPESLKTCEGCGREFTGIYSRKFCSSTCANRVHRLRQKANQFEQSMANIRAATAAGLGTEVTYTSEEAASLVKAELVAAGAMFEDGDA